MPVEAFSRTEGVWKTPSCEMPSESSPTRSVSASDVSRRTWATTAPHTDVQPYLNAIRRELFELKERRERLEVRRHELLQIQPRTAGENQPPPAPAAPSHSTEGLSSVQARSEAESTTARVGAHCNGVVAVVAPNPTITSEFQRRRQLAATPRRAVQSAAPRGNNGDSTLVMGDFLLEDNPRVCTFGRDRRFRPLVEHQGRYYVGCDTAADPQHMRKRQLAASAGWQTTAALSSDIPGPGTYTPRYNKVTRPLRLC